MISNSSQKFFNGMSINIVIFSLFFYVASTNAAQLFSKDSDEIRKAIYPELPPKRKRLGYTVGILTGYTSVNLDNYKDSWNFSLEFGFRPIRNFVFAFELGGFSSTGNGNLPSLDRSKVLGKGLYSFLGSIPFIRYTYIGAGLGLVRDRQGESNSTEFGFSPLMGFDIPLEATGNAISLGANYNYLFVGGARPNAIELNGVIKFVF